MYLLNYQVSKGVIIFTKTKTDCHRIFLALKLLNKTVAELHGKMPQSLRLKSLQDFQSGNVDILVATDLASRGLDLPVDAVINMHIPEEINKLLHRIGRTARAGQQGISISLCTDEERTVIRKTIKKNTSNLSIDKEKLEKAADEFENVNNKVREIIKDELIEREMEKAEMEAKKAKNLIDFDKEIFNRPKKEWIRKELPVEKKEDKARSRGTSKEMQGKIMRHKLMLQNYKTAAKGIKMIEKHVEKSRKPKNKKRNKSK